MMKLSNGENYSYIRVDNARPNTQVKQRPQPSTQEEAASSNNFVVHNGIKYLKTKIPHKFKNSTVTSSAMRRSSIDNVAMSVHNESKYSQ